MNLFITGGGGAIGRMTIERFLENGWNVTALSLPFETDRFSRIVSDRLRVVVADLNEINSDDIPQDATIVHLAAKVHSVPKTKSEIEDFFRVNVDGTSRLAEMALRRRCRSFIFVSTSAVYNGTSCEGPLSESMDLAPKTPYAKSKYQAECRLREVFPESFPLVVFRPSVMFGPGDRGNFQKLFRFARRGFMPIIAGGEVLKSVLYAGDFALLLRFTAEHADLFGNGAYNVAYEKPYSFADLVSAIEKTTRKKIRRIPVPLGVLKLPVLLGDGLGMIIHRELPLSSRKLKLLRDDSVIDVSRIHNALQDRFRIRSFEEGLREYIDTGESPWGAAQDFA